MPAGSGTVVPGGVAVVPNWITTLLNVEFTVTPGAMSEKVVVPTRNGLCGSFPAILPLAFAYAPLPVPPIIVWSGPAGEEMPKAQITQTVSVLPLCPPAQPVGLTAPAKTAFPAASILVDCALILFERVRRPP